ncbi:MAG: MBL fold metallo-hydrolase [Promethearchaeota archaeon]
MTKLTFYGAVAEVGGNKVLLEDGDTRIFMDFGMSFAIKKQYYSAYLTPKSEKELMDLDILPKVKGIYRFDDSEESVNGIFLSHSHLDHAGHISFLKRSIPVYCGETTALILDVIKDTRRTTFESDFSGIQFNTFRTGKKIKIDSLEIEPIHVDHSVPGAYGFVIHTSSGSIVYTGDFRLHGTKPEMTREFIQKAKESEPKALITEGTNLRGAPMSSESEVVEKLRILTEQTDGLIIGSFAWADVDRFRSFYTAAKESGRYLAVSLRQAYLLDKLSRDPGLEMPDLDDKTLLVFKRYKKRYEKWEQEILELGQVVEGSDISKIQSKTILVAGLYDFGELVRVAPTSGSCFAYSMSEPFDEEMEIDFEKLSNWLKRYGLPQYHIHTSGHIMPLQLRQTLKEIGGDQIFPIHTDTPELFTRFMNDLDSKFIMVKKGEEYKI